ncbi:restriction endonuclease [Neobacillus drentensis]|uniref:restriction endonuclease n=1 Tax=Neobacillus drentensis TaxID=220684 RepID=UPI002FFF3D60
MLKGYYGELNVAYHQSFLPENEYYIFHGLRLMDKLAFQMDVLLKSSKFVLIIEVKNISGRLKFEKGSDLMIRELNNLEEGMDNPLQQVKRHHLQFNNWLKFHQFKGIPVEHLVVISKTSTIIETNPDNQQIFQKIIYAESLLDKIRNLEEKYQKPRITKNTLTHLSETLLKAHHIYIPDILQKYNLSQSDLIPGVQCTNSKCKCYPMEYISASWRCDTCKETSKTAHIPTVSILLKARGYKVQLTSTTGDYGADLILSTDSTTIVVQAKRYQNTVGLKAVQEIVSAKGYYGADECWVITNSYFTEPALNLAESNNVVLIDRDQLIEWMLEDKQGANMSG